MRGSFYLLWYPVESRRMDCLQALGLKSRFSPQGADDGIAIDAQ